MLSFHALMYKELVSVCVFVLASAFFSVVIRAGKELLHIDPIYDFVDAAAVYISE